MTRIVITFLTLRCAVDLYAHPGHSPLESDATHQLTHLDDWVPLVLIVAVCSLVRFLQRKKL